MKKSHIRLLGVVAGAALLSGAAGMAMAEETVELGGDDAPEISVPIQAEIPGFGALSMTVDDTQVDLAETAGGVDYREFTGTLGDVTVTDTRNAVDIDEAFDWYVMGQAADFIGDAGQPDITVDHLGWTPAMVDDGGNGNVTEGSEVLTSMDAGPLARGLVDQELLYWSFPNGSQVVNPEGQWTANAELALRVPTTTAAGTNTSSLTLTLFED